MKRFKNTLYLIEKIVHTPDGFRYKTSDDGTLFSGVHRTKIIEEDLPEWYVKGRYYKRHGYLSAKGIKYMKYIPNKVFNHFLKDDCLLISYNEPITENPNRSGYSYDRYIGWDHEVRGISLLNILHAAVVYSDYDISEIKEQLKDKQKWLWIKQ